MLRSLVGSEMCIRDRQRDLKNFPSRTPSVKKTSITDEFSSLKKVLRVKSSKNRPASSSRRCHVYTPVKQMMTNPYRETPSTVSPIARDIAIRLTKDSFIMSEQLKRKAINATPVERGPRHRDYCKCELNQLQVDKGNQGSILKHDLFVSCQNGASDLSQLQIFEIFAILTCLLYTSPSPRDS